VLQVKVQIEGLINGIDFDETITRLVLKNSALTSLKRLLPQFKLYSMTHL